MRWPRHRRVRVGDNPRPGRVLLPYGVAIVHGRSMLPALAPGQRVLVRYAGRGARLVVDPGVIVLAQFPEGTWVLKRAVRRVWTARGELGWWLLSDNPEEGVDSRHRGPVAEGAILGVVVARLGWRHTKLWPPSLPGEASRDRRRAVPD